MLGTIGSVLGGAALSYLGGLDSAGGLSARLGSATQLAGSKKSLKQQMLYQKSYDKWKSNLDYEYAERYAQNSARWQMEGLENAGLNPILAVTNGSMAGTFGNASSGTVSSNFHSARQRLDLAGAAAAVSHTAKENALLDAQIKQVEAQTANTLIDARNKRETNGLSGNAAAVSVLAHKLGLGNSARSSDVAMLPDIKKNPLVYVEKAAPISRFSTARGLASDFVQWMKAGGFFGTPETRRTVIQDEMDKRWREE